MTLPCSAALCHDVEVLTYTQNGTVEMRPSSSWQFTLMFTVCYRGIFSQPRYDIESSGEPISGEPKKKKKKKQPGPKKTKQLRSQRGSNPCPTSAGVQNAATPCRPSALTILPPHLTPGGGQRPFVRCWELLVFLELK